MYQPTSFLEKAVIGGDPRTVRGALIGIIHADPSFSTKEFSYALQYAKENGVQVFELENNEALTMEMDSAKWDLDYFATAVTYLQANFTAERLAHVKQVSQATHNAPATPQMPTQQSQNQPKRAPQGQSQNLTYKQTGTQRPGVTPKKAMGHWGIALAAAGIALVALAGVLLLKG